MPQTLTAYRDDLAFRVSSCLTGLPDSDARTLALSALSALEIEAKDPSLFNIQVCYDEITVVRYDIPAALAAVVSLVGGIVGATSVSAGIAVVACLLALQNVRRPVSDAEGYVLLALQRLGGQADLETLAADVMGRHEPVAESEIKERVFDLAQSGALTFDNNIVQLKEHLRVRYQKISPSGP